MTAGEGRDTSLFLSTTFTHFHRLSNIQTCIYIYLQTLHEIWLPSIFNPIACLSDRYSTRFTTFGNLHLIDYLLNVNFSCTGCFNNKCYCSTRFFGWNWQKIKQKISNILRLNINYLRTIHILHPRHIAIYYQKSKCIFIHYIEKKRRL